MIRDKITEYFSAHREEMLGRLAALCRIPSVEGEPEAGKPFGAEIDRALALAEAMFREEGFPTERAPGGEYVLASFGEGERTVGIFAHADVVPAGEGWSVTAPFFPCEHEGLFVARGAEDNKAGIVAALYLLKAVRELALPVEARLLVFVGGNEETGMRDVMAFRRDRGAPDVSLVPDNDPPLIIGEKGRMVGWLTSPSVLRTVLAFESGTAYNMVPDRATATLADDEGVFCALSALIKARHELSLTREEGVLRLSAVGQAAHAADPADSKNAAAVLCEALSSCEVLTPEERREMTVAARFLSDSFGGTLGIADVDGPFGRRTAVSGVACMREGRLCLSLDIRYGSATSGEALSVLLSDTVRCEGWEFRPESIEDSFDHGDSDPLALALLSSYRRVTGEGNAVANRSGGGTYARHLPRAFSMGLAVNTVRPLQRDVLRPGHGDPHCPDEGLPVASYLAALRVLTEYVMTVSDFLANE